MVTIALLENQQELNVMMAATLRPAPTAWNLLTSARLALLVNTVREA